jgi:hypothetical protein
LLYWYKSTNTDSWRRTIATEIAELEQQIAAQYDTVHRFSGMLTYADES